MSALKIMALDVDYEKLLNYFSSMVEPDTPYCFESFNSYLIYLLRLTTDEEDNYDEEEEKLRDHIYGKISNPLKLLDITTTSKPGRVFTSKDFTYKVPLILSIETME